LLVLHCLRLGCLPSPSVLGLTKNIRSTPTLSYFFGRSKRRWLFSWSFEGRMLIFIVLPGAWLIAKPSLPETWHTVKPKSEWVLVGTKPSIPRLGTMPSPHSGHAHSLAHVQERPSRFFRPIKNRFIKKNSFFCDNPTYNNIQGLECRASTHLLLDKELPLEN